MSTKFESPWWYKQVPRDFMSSPDVMLMTAEECGSYFFLLQTAWLGGEGCTLPNDPARLARLARVEKVSDLVLEQFTEDKDGRLFNPRLMEDWKEAVRRSKVGKQFAEKRWSANGSPTGNPLPTQCQPNATKTKTKTKKKNLSDAPRTDSDLPTNVGSDSASTEPNPGPSEAGRRVGAKLAQILGRDTLTPGKQTEWAEQADKLVTQHGEQKVLDVMTHHLVESGDGFWRGRILAMKHLVRCFTTMQKQMRAGTRAAVDPLAARAASLQTGHDFSAIAKGDL